MNEYHLLSPSNDLDNEDSKIQGQMYNWVYIVYIKTIEVEIFYTLNLDWLWEHCQLEHCQWPWTFPFWMSDIYKKIKFSSVTERPY